MTSFTKYLFLAILCASVCLWQSVGLFAGQTSAQISPAPAANGTQSDKPHGSMPAELTKSLDSKKLKEGDAVTASMTAEVHTRDGGTIPRGSKMVGHVTEAKARSKGDAQATLGFVFDKITTPSGKDIAIKGVLQAVAPSTHSNEPAQSTSIGPGMMAGHEQGAAGTTPPATPTMSQSSPSVPLLNGQSKGVVGIHNLQLGDNSVLTSNGKEVKLDSGTQMIVLVEIQPQVE
jgi:hypothetical protein